eukprot:jgi/Astpho2/7100/fgenesh1_pg.00107_%23_104_t
MAAADPWGQAGGRATTTGPLTTASSAPGFRQGPMQVRTSIPGAHYHVAVASLLSNGTMPHSRHVRTVLPLQVQAAPSQTPPCTPLMASPTQIHTHQRPSLAALQMRTATSQSPMLPSTPVTPQSRVLGPPTAGPGLAQWGSGPLSPMRGMTPQQAASQAQQAERQVEAQQRLLAEQRAYMSAKCDELVRAEQRLEAAEQAGIAWKAETGCLSGSAREAEVGRYDTAELSFTLSHLRADVAHKAEQLQQRMADADMLRARAQAAGALTPSTPECAPATSPGASPARRSILDKLGVRRDAPAVVTIWDDEGQEPEVHLPPVFRAAVEHYEAPEVQSKTLSALMDDQRHSVDTMQRNAMDRDKTLYITKAIQLVGNIMNWFAISLSLF